jgi:hypothetical protein
LGGHGSTARLILIWCSGPGLLSPDDWAIAGSTSAQPRKRHKFPDRRSVPRADPIAQIFDLGQSRPRG